MAESWCGDAYTAQADTSQNVTINRTTIHNEGCNFGEMTQQNTTHAIQTTVNIAEERHQAIIDATNSAHARELDSRRREAHNALSEQANRLAWERHLATTQAAAAAEPSPADSAMAARLRELEIALETQRNELAAIRIKESDTASQLAVAAARSWAIHGGEDSSGGYETLPSVSSTASQHGLLASLAAGANNFVFGRKGAQSDATTSVPTVTGYEGSQVSAPYRSLVPIDLYTFDPTGGAQTSQDGGPPTNQYTTTQTVMAPTRTTQGQDRSPPVNPYSGASSSGGANPRRPPGGEDYEDDDKGPPKGGPPKGDPTSQDGGPGRRPPPGPPSEDPPIEDGEESEIDVGGANARRHSDRDRIREADRIVLKGFPQGNQWRAWRALTTPLSHGLCGASQNKPMILPSLVRVGLH